MAVSNLTPVTLWQSCIWGPPSVIAVFFLCPLPKSKEAEICQKLAAGAPDAPRNSNLSSIVPVPWILKFTPHLSAILSIHGLYTHVFIDEHSVRDGTAIVRSSFTRDRKPDVARIELQRANQIVTEMRSSHKSLSDFVPADAMIDVEMPQRSEQQNTGYEMQDLVSDHLPRNIEWKSSTLALISLVHLSDEEMNHIKSLIGTTEEITSVAIHNWPNPDKPCTRAGLYRIFQAIKTNLHPEKDELCVLFLDVNWHAIYDNLVDEDNKYQVLCAHRILCDDPKDFFQNVVDVFSLDGLEYALDLWQIIWHPLEAAGPVEAGGQGTRFSRARVHCTIDERIRDGTFRKGTFTEVIANPENCVIGPSNPPVFILDGIISSNTRNFRIVRDYMVNNFEDPCVFYDVSQYLETANMRGLMKYLESESFLAANQSPPSSFMAVDRKTLQLVRLLNDDESVDSTESSDEEEIEEGESHRGYHNEEPIIIASCQPLQLTFNDDEDKSWARQHLGYAYGRVDGYNANLTWTNLEIGNMYFNECVSIEDWIYWSSCRAWLAENFTLDDVSLVDAAYPFEINRAFHPERRMRE